MDTSWGLRFPACNSRLTNDISAYISMNDEKLEEATSFKYLCATVCKDGTCSTEIRISILSAMAAYGKIKKGLAKQYH